MADTCFWSKWFRQKFSRRKENFCFVFMFLLLFLFYFLLCIIVASCRVGSGSRGNCLPTVFVGKWICANLALVKYFPLCIQLSFLPPSPWHWLEQSINALHLEVISSPEALCQFIELKCLSRVCVCEWVCVCGTYSTCRSIIHLHNISVDSKCPSMQRSHSRIRFPVGIWWRDLTAWNLDKLRGILCKE